MTTKSLNVKKLYPEFDDPTKFDEFFNNLSTDKQNELKDLMKPYVDNSRETCEFIKENDFRPNLSKINKENAFEIGNQIIEIIKSYPNIFYCCKKLQELFRTQHPWYTVIHKIDDYIVKGRGLDPDEYPSHLMEDTIRKLIFKNSKLKKEKGGSIKFASMSLFSLILYIKLGGIIESTKQLRDLLWKAKGMKEPCCEKCGSKHYNIHHLDENHYNNSIDNIIYVCPNHHKEYHQKSNFNNELLV